MNANLMANKHADAYQGLSDRESIQRLERYGLNVLTSKKKYTAFKILVSQFSDFMVMILIGATIISAFMGELTESITIIAIIIVNALLGFFQEYRTEKTMEALKNLSAPMAKVIRNGKIISIKAENIVPEDLMVLESGDRVSADGYLIEENGLQVDESLLTGESVAVQKNISDIKAPNAKKYGEKSTVYMGTIVTHGRGKAIVSATGMKTEMGKIADMIQEIEDEDTPLKKRLDHLGTFIVYGCLSVCAIVVLTGILRGENFFTMLLAGISLAVAAVPEGLPATVTIALALGVQKMLKKKAMIRKLPAVETLGCASVICSDKTGTLTQNKMSVRKIFANENIVDIKESNKEAIKGFYINHNLIDESIDGIRLTLIISGMCNNAKVSEEKCKSNFGKIRSFLGSQKQIQQFYGDPTEIALKEICNKAGLSSDELNKMYVRIHELPFDSTRKCMSVICNDNYNQSFVFTKGAPDILINKCTKVHTPFGVVDLTQAIKNHIININNQMAKEALRVIATAYKKYNFKDINEDDIEKDLIFVGLVGMIDPPRKEAQEAVRKCRMAGIKPIMVTGDHKITATAIASELNIYTKGDRVLTGEEIDKIGEDGLYKVANNVTVYARVSPRHKLMIVKVLKRLEHIVAMTGDGVNDAPAIKEADIGISMGITGTDVTKEASSMILLDDNFATIISAVEEGRAIYSNIRKFIRYMLSCNIGEVLTMFLGMLIGLPIPLLPIQILWVNLITDGLPAIALGLDPSEKDVMLKRPRGTNESIFSHGLLNIILFRGVLIGISTLAIFISILHFTCDVEIARTAAFVTLVIIQLIHVFECKSETKNIFEIPIFNNIFLVISVIISLALILGVVYIPVFQGIFKTVSLSFNDWILIIGFSALGPVVASFFTRILKKIGRRKLAR